MPVIVPGTIIEKAASGIPGDAFSILLSHTPEVYEEAAHVDFNLMLSGHTHGGQICLPGGIPIILNSVLPRYMGSGAWAYRGMSGYTSSARAHQKSLYGSIVRRKLRCTIYSRSNTACPLRMRFVPIADIAMLTSDSRMQGLCQSFKYHQCIGSPVGLAVLIV